jgi:uncharacterized protein (DUF1697 family)
MNIKIGILRGINVGGKRKILMSDLKLLCEELGLINITTYIQSGNLIFNSEKSNLELENELEKAIAEKYGFDVLVIVLSKEELDNSIRNNPFTNKEVDIQQLHLTFLKEKPSKENIEIALKFNYEPDKFIINNKDIYVFCNGKYHESKLSNNFFEKHLKVGATTRNWKTILQLSELSRKLN